MWRGAENHHLGAGIADLRQPGEQGEQLVGAVEGLDDQERGRRLVLVELHRRRQGAVVDHDLGPLHAPVARRLLDHLGRLGPGGEGVDGDTRHGVFAKRRFGAGQHFGNRIGRGAGRRRDVVAGLRRIEFLTRGQPRERIDGGRSDGTALRPREIVVGVEVEIERVVLSGGLGHGVSYPRWRASPRPAGQPASR